MSYIYILSYLLNSSKSLNNSHFRATWGAVVMEIMNVRKSIVLLLLSAALAAMVVMVVLVLVKMVNNDKRK